MADPVSTMPLRALVASPWRMPLVVGAAALAVLAVGSIVLPTFLVNNLIRSFLYAALALTVDHRGQLLAEARQQFLTRQAGLPGENVDLIRRQDPGQVGRRDRLVLSCADP